MFGIHSIGGSLKVSNSLFSIYRNRLTYTSKLFCRKHVVNRSSLYCWLALFIVADGGSEGDNGASGLEKEKKS